MDISPLPCPLCGADPSVMVNKSVSEPGKLYWLKCNQCGTEQMGMYKYPEAVGRWNMRLHLKDPD